MNNNISKKKFFKLKRNQFDKLISDKIITEKDLKGLIESLYLDNIFLIFDENNFNLLEMSRLFRFYEKKLINLFQENKEEFQTFFNLYILLIELFTQLTIIFSLKKEHLKFIEAIFETLKESKTILKLSIKFEEKELKIINNIIGEQLYYFSHIQNIHIKDKSFDHYFEEFFLNCERIQHGFELSRSTNFADNPKKDENYEELIYINNLSFLLLKMIYKLNYFHKEIDYFKNKYFQNILIFFKNNSHHSKNKNIYTQKCFENSLLREFHYSSSSLYNYQNINMYEEKIKLLASNTDEYKQLIDIILNSK